MVESRNLGKLKLLIDPGFIGEWHKFGRKKKNRMQKMSKEKISKGLLMQLQFTLSLALRE